MSNFAYHNEIIEFAQRQEKKLKVLEYRPHSAEFGTERQREEYSRDYARILYSSSFRRLQGKMQLLGVSATHFYRNRLTHSLEVAQISRTIAQDMKLEFPIVTECCALAHDIGNPPFGHSGEKILNELGKNIVGFEGFEGNAQTFRILRTLEKKSYEYSGLNLTMRTLFGVVKYFFAPKDGKKKFLYQEDYDFLKGILTERGVTTVKSIDAQIMDIADEIAYAAHDLEDALSAGIINLGEITHEFQISSEYKSAYDVFSQEIVKKVQSIAMKSRKLETSEEYSVVLRKELTSTIVNRLCRDIDLVTKDGITTLGYKKDALLAEGLKKLLFRAILRRKDIQLYEKKGEKVIRGLYEVYTDKKYNKDNLLLPPELRKLECEHQERLVLDYISGMMDYFAIQEYTKYFGGKSLDGLYFKDQN